MTNTPQGNEITLPPFPGRFQELILKLIVLPLRKPMTVGTSIATTSRIMIPRFTSQTPALGSAILLGLANALDKRYRQYKL